MLVTPLHCAASYAATEAVSRLLLAAKANVNARNNQGETPIRWAEDATYELLRDAGGDNWW